MTELINQSANDGGYCRTAQATPGLLTSCVDVLPVSCREYGLSTHTHKLCIGLEGGRAEALEVKGWRPKICGETLSPCTV